MSSVAPDRLLTPVGVRIGSATIDRTASVRDDQAVASYAFTQAPGVNDIDTTSETAQRRGILQSLQLANSHPDRAFELIAMAARNAADADGGYVAFVGDSETRMAA